MFVSDQKSGTLLFTRADTGCSQSLSQNLVSLTASTHAHSCSLAIRIFEGNRRSIRPSLTSVDFFMTFQCFELNACDLHVPSMWSPAGIFISGWLATCRRPKSFNLHFFVNVSRQGRKKLKSFCSNDVLLQFDSWIRYLSCRLVLHSLEPFYYLFN